MYNAIDRSATDKTKARYNRIARFYDAIEYGSEGMFKVWRKQLWLQASGDVLEVGVGTGLSFDDYDAKTEITGIDICAPMLEKARAKLATGRYPYVKDVLLMDAHKLAFEDATFDCVVAQFVITLVENPEAVLSECRRVVKPGGRIILVNHLYSETGLSAAFERWAAKHARKIGLRPEFPFARLTAWAEASGDATLIERRKVSPFYTLVSFARIGGDRQNVQAA